MATRRRVTSGKPKKRVGPRKMDMGKAQQKAEEIEQRNQSEYHELQQGWNYFYIMPPYSDENVVWKEVQRHGLHVCPKLVGRDCMACKEIKKRIKRGDTDFVDENRLKTQGYMNALRKGDIKAMDPDLCKVLRASPTVFGEIVDFITEEKIDITDPTAAHFVRIHRKGTGMRTKYKTKVSSEAVDLSRWITEKVLEGMFDLDTIRATQPASDKELRKLIRGGADADDDDDDNEDFSGSDLDDDDEGEEGAGEEADELEEGGDVEDELFDDPEEGEEEIDLGEEEGEEEGEEGEEGEEEGGEDDDDFFGEEEEEPAPPPKKTTKKKTTRRRTK